MERRRARRACEGGRETFVVSGEGQRSTTTRRACPCAEEVHVCNAWPRKSARGTCARRSARALLVETTGEHAHERADDYLWAPTEGFRHGREHEWADAEHCEVGEGRRLEDVGRDARVVLTEAAARSAIRLGDEERGQLSSLEESRARRALAARGLVRPSRERFFRVVKRGTHRRIEGRAVRDEHGKGECCARARKEELGRPLDDDEGERAHLDSA